MGLLAECEVTGGRAVFGLLMMFCLRILMMVCVLNVWEKAM